MPLSAGVASGEIILAVAVLSILLTALLGAIGIMIFGERILDYGDKFSLYQFKQLREKLALPRAGERVMSKRFGNIWKVIEEKEIWIKTPLSNDSLRKVDIIPAIQIRYWCEDTHQGAGTGKTLAYQYSESNTSSFNEDWEILYDW